MTAAGVARRRLPPYARPLADARRKGLVPVLPKGVMVLALGWSAYRCIEGLEELPAIVLPLDFHTQDYDLRPLAGLGVLVLYEPEDSWRMGLVLEALKDIRLQQLAMMSTVSMGGGRTLDDGYDEKVFREWHPQN